MFFGYMISATNTFHNVSNCYFDFLKHNNQAATLDRTNDDPDPDSILKLFNQDDTNFTFI